MDPTDYAPKYVVPKFQKKPVFKRLSSDDFKLHLNRLHETILTKNEKLADIIFLFKEVRKEEANLDELTRDVYPDYKVIPFRTKQGSPDSQIKLLENKLKFLRKEIEYYTEIKILLDKIKILENEEIQMIDEINAFFI